MVLYTDRLAVSTPRTSWRQNHAYSMTVYPAFSIVPDPEWAFNKYIWTNQWIHEWKKAAKFLTQLLSVRTQQCRIWSSCPTFQYKNQKFLFLSHSYLSSTFNKVSLKPGMMGVFILWKSSNSTNQEFFFFYPPWRVKHLTAHSRMSTASLCTASVMGLFLTSETKHPMWDSHHHCKCSGIAQLLKPSSWGISLSSSRSAFCTNTELV